MSGAHAVHALRHGCHQVRPACSAHEQIAQRLAFRVPGVRFSGALSPSDAGGILNPDPPVDRCAAQAMALESITCGHDGVQLFGAGATHPAERRCATMAALRICAMPWRKTGVRALPARHSTARSGTSNSRIQNQGEKHARMLGHDRRPRPHPEPEGGWRGGLEPGG
jgi:hypothetical protein